MEMFFADPDDVPLPPSEVRILNMTLDPYPDGRRVRVFIELTPFQKKPHGDVWIKDNAGNVVAEASFIEAVTKQFEMILHLRSFDPEGKYTASLILFYSQEVEDEVEGDRTLVRPEKNIVDQKIVNFQIVES
jgi:hypothetical protein